MRLVTLSLFVLFIILMIAQGVYTLYANLFAWSKAGRIYKLRSPRTFIHPKLKFSVFLPAFHEEEVLGKTIKLAADFVYPKKMYEILIILQPSDKDTIEVAKKAIKDHKIKNARILIVNPKHLPLNKPYQLNYALMRSKYQKCVIFDSEDVIHKQILNIANTYLVKHPDVDILQSGVQLMDYGKNWFSSHNVLEYYFWFKSRMHAHINGGVVPLGGNTVFFDSQQLRDVGGWNEQCLTEDAEVGLRLSIKGAKFAAIYDNRHVTKEETPPSISQFIKQRTRWCQGFLQIVDSKVWMDLPTTRKKLLCLYLLGFPAIQAMLFLLSPLIAFAGLSFKLPIVVSMASFIPVFLAMAMYAVQFIGLIDFIKEQNLKYNFKQLILFFPTLPLYQLMLSVGALRAVFRHYRKINNWEKTQHLGLNVDAS